MISAQHAESSGACYISVGANIRPEENIVRALEQLNCQCPIRKISVFYQTSPIERPEQPDYLNGVVQIQYCGPLHTLKHSLLHGIEESLGRIRTSDKYAARPIDLDILLYNALVSKEPDMIIPDPDIYTRPFLAAALFDLNPDLVLPDTQTSLRDIISSLSGVALRRKDSFTQRLKERFLHEY